MELFYTIRSSLRRMPYGLRNITCLCLVFTLFLPAAFLPFGEHSIDGVQVSFTEFWERGGGPLVAGIGVTCGVLAYGFIRARRWVRPLAVLPGFLLAVIVLLFERPFNAEVIAAVLFFGCLPMWYLYRRRPVRDYFSPDRVDRMA